MKRLLCGWMVASLSTLLVADDREVIHIGSRLELMVDDFLVQEMTGGARLELHRPECREVVLRTDEPWGGNASGYQSVFKDGDLYRMYYRGLHYRHSGEPAQAFEAHAPVLCYAESDDGIHWRKPELGLFEFNGSKANNILLTREAVAQVKGYAGSTAVFLDTNPDCPPDAKYKIIMRGGKPFGLYVLKSADGIRFTLMSDKPFATRGALDSQNTAFWDPVRKEYREYHRGFKHGVRDILTSTSKDILHFPEPRFLEYPGSPTQALYTNQIQPYYRAPHILMGFPQRYNGRGWSEPMLALPELDERLARAKHRSRYGTTLTDSLFMTSRDGWTFRRWSEAFIRPGPRQKDSWTYGDNFIFWGMVETASHLEDAPKELSLYAVEGYWRGTSVDIRRYTIRIDGFVSASAPLSGGEIITKPIVFDGGNLALNMETSAAGSMQVEIQDAEGHPVEGYALADCPEIFCDNQRHIVRWNHGGDVRSLAGKPIRLRFLLKDADLYSFQFVPHAPEPERPDLAPYSRPGEYRAPKETVVFRAGEGPYPHYRIPAVVSTRGSIVLAFCEGRQGGDHSHNDIVLRRSLDSGKTWEPLQVVRHHPEDAFNNPTAVVLEGSGRVLLFYQHFPDGTGEYKVVPGHTGERIVSTYLMYSDDDGITWSEPRNITSQTKKSTSWTSVCCGPGVAIQLRRGKHPGRLVVPANHGNQGATEGWNVHCLYSDDGGETFQIGGDTESRLNECQVVELLDGTLMMNMRNYLQPGQRAVALSHDGGESWGKVRMDPTLPEPTCQASLLRFSDPLDKEKSRLLFSNPADSDKRIRMTVRVSYDEGKSWPVRKVIHEGPAAYSCLTRLPDHAVGLLYEAGEKDPYETIRLAVLLLEWLTDGEDSLWRP
jgi:hypothetical protein